MKNTFRHPKELQETPKVSMSIRINPDTKQALEKYAEKYGLTVSAIIDATMADYVQFLHSGKDKE